MTPAHRLDEVTRILSAAEGAQCWDIGTGPQTLPTFSLSLGERVPRKVPLKNKQLPHVSRNYQGSVRLLVWSAWRLQDNKEVISGSGQAEEEIPSKLLRLRGEHIEQVTCQLPAWDLTLRFSGSLELRVFCDAVAPSAAISQNWDFWVPGYLVSAGPGADVLVEREQSSSA